MSSIFSRIISGEIPADKLYEDEHLIAILDINPIQKGHTLLIPKQEVRWVEQMDDPLWTHTFLVAKKMMEYMKVQLGCDYVQLVVEGVEVAHAHVHLIPSTLQIKNQEWHHVSYREWEVQHYKEKLTMNI